MSIAELRLQLHEAIDTLSDKAQLEAIYSLIKGSAAEMDRMSVEEYAQAIDKSKEDIKKGHFRSQEELERESENW